MSTSGALYLFLAATIVAVFTFLSIAAWLGTQSAERQARDRFALLRSIAEHPSDTAEQVLRMLRDQEQRRAQRRERAEERSRIIGGLVLIATGIGICVLLDAVGKTWTGGLVPLLIGCVLLGSGLFLNRGTDKFHNVAADGSHRDGAPPSGRKL